MNKEKLKCPETDFDLNGGRTGAFFMANKPPKKHL